MSLSKKGQSIQQLNTKAGRFYRIGGEGKSLPSVTTVLKIIHSEPLTDWMVKEERDGVLEAAGKAFASFPSFGWDGITGTEFIEHIKRQLPRGKCCYAKSKAAADHGTLVHGLIEGWAKGNPPPSCFSPVPEIRHGYDAFLRWATKVDLEPVAVEKRVASEELGVAGTLDMVGRLTRKTGTRVLALVDVKTSKAVYPSMFLQLALYREALRHMGEEVPEVSVIVRVPKTLDEPEVEITWDRDPERSLRAAMAAIHLWEWNHENEEAYKANLKRA